MATLADMSLGNAIYRAAGGRISSMVTTSLSVDYLGNASVGNWIEARAVVTRVGRRMAFATSHIWHSNNCIAQATGAFLILARQDATDRGQSP